MSIKKGSLKTKSSGNIKYIYECGRFKISPAGTEFFLRYSGEKLEAEVIEGKIAVSDHGFSVTISEGQKWTSENPDRIESAAPHNEPDLKSDKRDDIIKPENEVITEKNLQTEKKEDGSSEYKKNREEKKERIEKSKSKQELIDEMKQMKKEQRQERKGKNRE